MKTLTKETEPNQITDRDEIRRLRAADPFRSIHEETVRLIGWDMCVLRERSENERGWSAPVAEDGDGAAAGNIVKDEVQVLARRAAQGWSFRQRRRSVATNQNFVSCGEWVEEPLTW